MTGRPLHAEDVQDARRVWHRLPLPEKDQWTGEESFTADRLTRVVWGAPERGDDDLRAADDLADAGEMALVGGEPQDWKRLDDAVHAYRAARDVAPTDELAGLPVVVGSVDAVAAVCRAHGLTSSDPGTWEHGTGVLVEAALWHDRLDVVYVGTRQGRMVRIDNGCPASVLSHAITAAIEAARGGVRRG